MSPSDSDFVARFLLEELDIRGAFVRLGESWRSMLARRDYAATVRELLGEMTATAVLIGSNLKQPGRLSFQLKGHGPIGFLFIDCTAQLHLRGMAQAAADVAPAPVSQLFGDGHLSLILQNASAREPYQSLVPAAGESIAAIFEHYLLQSEQQPARLLLTAGEEHACGLFLQKLPGADAKDADGWTRIELLAKTVTPDELRTLTAEALLGRLFPEEAVRLFKPRPVVYDCPEDRDKVSQMLRSLGRAEVESILAEQGEVVVHDDICNHTYRFGAADLDELFPPGGPEPRTLH